MEHNDLTFYIFESKEEAEKEAAIDFTIFMKNKTENAYIEEMVGSQNHSILQKEYEKYKNNLITKDNFIATFNSLNIPGSWDNVKLIDNPNHQYYNYYCYLVLNPPRDNLVYIKVNNLEELFIITETEASTIN